MVHQKHTRALIFLGVWQLSQNIVTIHPRQTATRKVVKGCRPRITEPHDICTCHIDTGIGLSKESCVNITTDNHTVHSYNTREKTNNANVGKTLMCYSWHHGVENNRVLLQVTSGRDSGRVMAQCE